jgi:type II secretory pathway component GspD/PulD (secretin)
MASHLPPEEASPTAEGPPEAPPPDREVVPPPPEPRTVPSGRVERVEPVPPDKPPMPPGRVRIPVPASIRPDQVQFQETNGRISLTVREVPLNRLMMFVGQQLRLSILCADNATAPVSVSLRDVPLEDALTSICSIAGCTWMTNNGIIHVTSVSTSSKSAPEIQGRQVRVFRLDFAAATDVQTAVKGMLSPVGQCWTSEAKAQDNRKTHDTIVVQDLPNYLRNVTEYITQIDVAPRQVLVEAHVLSIDLTGDQSLGVNFKDLFHNEKGRIELKGMANANASQALFFSYDSADLKFLLEALATQKNAKTLASPKVLVLNGQEARFQVGQQLGFRVTTTTETSTMESVSFLNVGVVLKVTPRITRDGRVLMSVKPEVSKGLVNEKTGLPEQDTTQVESSLMLPDGRGMVIGGLIEEKDHHEQQKVAILGDLWLVGRLFQHHRTTRERKEVIITLLPRIVPDCIAECDRHSVEVERARTPLLQGALEPVQRPWEPVPPDALENPFRLKDKLKRHCGRCNHNPCTCAGDGTPYYAGEQPPQSCPQPTDADGHPSLSPDMPPSPPEAYLDGANVPRQTERPPHNQGPGRR